MAGKIDRYKQKILLPLHIMKGIFIAIVLMNLFLPTTRLDTAAVSVLAGLGLKLLLVLCTAMIIIFHFWGLLNGLGYFNQSVPMVPIIIIRAVESFLLGANGAVNWVPFGITLFLDLVFLIYLLKDKSSYEYIREKNSELVEEDL